MTGETDPRKGWPPDGAVFAGTAPECPECGATVDVWCEGFRFDDRRALVIEMDSFCRACQFAYHGDVAVDKMGGSLGVYTTGDDDAEDT